MLISHARILFYATHGERVTHALCVLHIVAENRCEARVFAFHEDRQNVDAANQVECSRVGIALGPEMRAQDPVPRRDALICDAHVPQNVMHWIQANSHTMRRIFFPKALKGLGI
jgi:hypothetical protein